MLRIAAVIGAGIDGVVLRRRRRHVPCGHVASVHPRAGFVATEAVHVGERPCPQSDEMRAIGGEAFAACGRRLQRRPLLRRASRSGSGACPEETFERAKRTFDVRI